VITIGGIQSNQCRATTVAAEYIGLDSYLILRTNWMLGNLLADKLKSQGWKPYVVHVRGSNSLGTWGYIEFVRELKNQLQEGRTSGVTHFDDIVMACGRFVLHYSLCSLLFLYAG
jgi:D-cysteine desulfhydrase